MRLILILACSSLLFSGCKKLTEFYIEDEVQFDVPATSGLIPLDILSPETTTNFEQTFEVNDSRVDWTEDARLEKVTLQIVSPASEDFSFMEDVELYLSAPNEPEILLAYSYDIPSTIGNTIELTTTGKSLTEFLDEERITMRTKIVTDEPLQNNITVEADYRIFVKAKTRVF